MGQHPDLVNSLVNQKDVATELGKVVSKLAAAPKKDRLFSPIACAS